MQTKMNKRVSNNLIHQGFKNNVKCSKSPAESSMHRVIKFAIANFCWDNKLEFMTEVTFSNGQRADLVILDWAVVFEVLHSEYRLKETKNYPLPVLAISTKTKVGRLYEILNDLKTSNGALINYYINKLSEDGTL